MEGAREGPFWTAGWSARWKSMRSRFVPSFLLAHTLRPATGMFCHILTMSGSHARPNVICSHAHVTEKETAKRDCTLPRRFVLDETIVRHANAICVSYPN